MGLGCGLTVAALAAPAFAAPGRFGDVVVAPKSGPGNTLIAVEYRQNGMGGVCTPVQVVFKWDGRNVATAGLTKNCVAKSAFRPPKDDRTPGPHQVSAWDNKGNTLGGAAIFVVTVGDPSPSPSASVSASASPSRSKTPKPTASPTDDPVEVDPPLPTDDGPSVDGTVAAAAPGDGQNGSGSGGGGFSSIGVALAFGGALVLGGVVILGFIVFRGRREDSDPEPSVLGESPTQPIPGFSGFIPHQPSAPPTESTSRMPGTTAIEPVFPPPVPE